MNFFTAPSGAGQMTQAQQVLVAAFSRGAYHNPVSLGLTTPRRRRRRTSKATRAPSRKRSRRSPRSNGRARLVKGSAAAKRYMAKIRKMRRR